MRLAVLSAWDFSADRRSPPVLIGSIARAVVVLAALLAAGCKWSPPPEFRLNLEGRDPDEITLVQSEAITETLDELFGTPDQPAIPDEAGLDLRLLEMAAGPTVRAEEVGRGSVYQHGLYRQHCALCHGISGDGAGPLVSVLDPYPRDFRKGIFKYTSTLAGAKPTGEDIEWTLARGIPGTGMPSFAGLKPAETAALIEYVEYLSIRGQTESYVIQLIVDEDEYLPLGADAKEMILDESALSAAESWALPEQYAEQYVVVPPPRSLVNTPQRLADSIALGRELYAGEDAQCVKCHGPDGAGDGEETELYDDWNKPKKGLTPEETKELARWFTLPLQRLRARDFREGAFRGGDRPEDLYWRVYIGIKGTPMPPVGPSPGTPGVMTPEEIWHVVDYIRSLSE
ncbi:MAG: c-type cytochrome [Planctomycetota bacterium]